MVGLWVSTGLGDGKIERTSGSRTITESITIAESGLLLERYLAEERKRGAGKPEIVQ